MLAATCPLMRQHGNRDTRIWGQGWTKTMTSAATNAIKLRDSLRDYVYEQLQRASTDGVPLQRYLWHDFPEDPRVWTLSTAAAADADADVTVDVEFMFGDSYLVAPVVRQGHRTRLVYFPKSGVGKNSTSWRHHRTGAVHDGGTTALIEVLLDDIALFERV